MRVLPPLLAVIGILLAAILPGSAVYAQAQTVDLRLSPAATSTASGGTVQLTVRVEPNGQQVNGADVCITFPAALLQVTQVQPVTSIFGTVLANSVDNSNGVIKYSAGTFGTAPTATFNLATIDLQAASVNDVANVAFSTSSSVCGATPTDAVFGASSVLRNTFGSTVTIGNPVSATPTPTSVPGATGWGLIAAAGVLALLLAWRLRRRAPSV